MSKKLVLVVLSLYWLLFFSRLGYSQYEIRVSEKLWVTCPRNLAVFHILVMLGPSGEEMKNRFFHPLAKQARDYFSGFKGHPAVLSTDRLFKTMWYFVFNNLAFYYSEFPEAKLVREFPSEYEEWKSMDKKILAYMQSVRDFYARAQFESFWRGRAQDIQSLMLEVKNNFPAVDLPQLMENFYGRPVERFYFVPCPFMASSATHVEIQENGKWTFYHIDGFQNYADSFSNAYHAFHEFSHSFIEPISRGHSEEIGKLSYLHTPLKQDFGRMGYGSWERAFAEHMVTAGQLHLTRKAFGEKKAERMLERETKQGFKLIKRFYDYFKDYDEKRGKYKDLEDFYPEILSRLSRLKVAEYRRPGIMGFYPEYKENRLYIKEVIPDSALDKGGIQKNDILFSVGKEKINSEESFNRAKEKWWNAAKEGDSVEIGIIREGKEIKIKVPIPFVMDFRYVEDK